MQYNQNCVVIGEKPENKKMNYKEFKDWFNKKNESDQKDKNNYSKKLGSMKDNFGDPYVQGLLTDIFSERYENIDFNNDDNGVELVKDVLGNNNTYGFDFDMFEPNKRIVIDFLKRQNEMVTNLTSHPCRYTKNKQKFISLWKAAQRVNNRDANLFSQL